MRGIKLTSPGLLLIFAVLSAGGIFLVDLFFLRPHVARQEAAALSDQAAEVEQVAGLVLRGEQTALRRSCASWALRSGARTSLSPRTSQKRFSTLAREALGPAAVDFACLRDSEDKLVAVWSADGSQDAWREAVGALKGKNQSLPGSRALVEHPLAVVKLADAAALAAWHPLGGASDDPDTRGCLWVARRVDAVLLARVSKTINGELTFVASTCLPEVAPDNVVASRVYWPSGDDKLAVAWRMHDPAGKTVGYFQAAVPVGHVYRQAVIARRTVLIVVSLSVGLVLLVIVGVHMLIAGPVVRLMRRLQEIEAGRVDREGLTDNLHGEPLAVAKRLESAFDKLDHISKTDQLTGLANRGHFEQMLSCAFEQARRYNRPLSVMVLDLDFFKAINDAAGHQAGDEMLKSVAQSILHACRKADQAARFGGDEYAVLLPESTADDVVPVARRIRETVARQAVENNSVKVKVTISVGIADLNSGTVGTPEALVNLADRALYAAKELGRNRCVLAHNLDGMTWPDICADDGRMDLLYKKLAGLDTQFKDLFIRAVEEVVDALEERNPHMVDHARRVRRYCLLIAREMELPDRLIKHLSGAAMLHDIGMLALPDWVLLCPRPLNEQQWQIMQRHPLIGARIMEGMEFLEQEIPTVKYHHERFDGKGYPEGLVGAEIPLPARILAVADAFEAMTSSRPFRAAKARNDVLRELKRKAGIQFDPVVVEAFLSVARRLGDDLVAPLSSQEPAKGIEQAVTS